MNTGHDGSMATLHSNSPRECLARMENMVMMSDIKIPKEAISRQIADSVDLIVQVKRLRDGSRRTTNITEVIGMEGDVIVTQELFKFEYLDETSDGKIVGEYRSMGLRPYTLVIIESAVDARGSSLIAVPGGSTGPAVFGKLAAAKL